MALLGPFTTYEHFTLAERGAYWGGLIFGALPVAFGIRLLMFRVLRGSILRVDATAALVMAVTLGTGIWAVNVRVMGFAVGGLWPLIEHIVIAALICFLLVGLRAHIRSRLKARSASEAPAPAFLRRLEPDLRGALLSVSANDHLLEVWTERGRSRLRMRLGDALQELAEFAGARIHRSHWVAFAAVRSVEMDGRRYKVTLNDGRELPVSRNGAEPLRAVGLLEPDGAALEAPPGAGQAESRSPPPP